MSVLVRLNDEEERALFALPAETRICYVLGMRPFMDFKTGIVGDKRRISYQSLMELLEYEPDRGSHLGTICRPSLEKVRNELARCERAGLIERLPKRRRTDPLRLKMVLADIDGVNLSGEEPQTNHKKGTPRVLTVVGSSARTTVAGFDSFVAVSDSVYGNNGAPNDEPHTSVLPFTTTTTKYKSNAHDAALLAADWLPAVETMTRLVRDELVDVDFVNEYTSEFVMYWLASGVAKGSWDAVFFRQCLDQWKLRRFSWSRR